MSDKPTFRFHPDAYEHGCFEESDETCAACKRACVWKYISHIYAQPPDVEVVCARCIADGSLAKVVPDGDYSLHDLSFDDEPSEELMAEVEQRTPGFATYNPFVWPVRDGVPLAFLGFGEDDNLAREHEVKTAIAALGKEMGSEIAPGDAMIFRTLDGAVYVATLDMD
ncbi:MAG TPA: CbrC family protein [Verrucomicrobiae bacterium]|nr:CbrC family protein [Verrucomicrobiae bacterium]